MHKTQLYQWPDKMLFIGPLQAVAAHRHGANAWCLSLERELGLAPARGDGWRHAAAAQIALGHPHRLHGGGHPVAVLYLHPEYDDWRSAAQAAGPAGARLLSRAAPLPHALLNDAYRSGALAPCAVAELGRRLDRFVYGERPAGSGVRRDAVGAAVACLKQGLDQNLSLREVAAAAGLSPGRLVHRFSAELGLPMRRFRAWHRLVRALQLAAAGSPLTAAALDSGFASPAHLSAAFQATFGVSPSAVLRAPQLEVLFSAPPPRP